MTHPIPPEVVDRLRKRIFCANPDDDGIPVHIPYTGELLHKLPSCTAEDVRQAVSRARQAQRLWAARPLEQRAGVLKRYHALLMEHREELHDIIQLETGKSRMSAAEEVLDVAIVARHYGFHGPNLLRPKRRRGVFPVITSAEVRHHPRGVVGLIAPWNYPFTLPLGDTLPALLAGNAVVMKPACETSLTALMGAELLEKAGLPPDLLVIVTGRGTALGPAMIEEVDFVQFSGSTATGKQIAEQCAKRLIGCSLELGGKNPAIVFADAPFQRAVSGVLKGVFGSTGQLCIHIERIYVQDAIYERFVSEMILQTRRMKMGSAFDFSTQIGSLSSSAQLEKVSFHVEDAVAKGARVLVGGKARPDLGPFFYEPTLLEGVTEGMHVAREETFGPVASVYKFRTTEEVLEAANDSEYGLNASVWTKNTSRGRGVAGWLQCGTVNVNESYATTWGSTDAPMGGFKQSGIGRRHGDTGLLKYTEPQTIATQYLLNLSAPKGVSEGTFAKVLYAAIRLLRQIPGLR
ncbi:MAG: succinic semialdehyde dehydrogenase [bacterium]